MPTQKTVATTGNLVVAEAMRQCAPDVVAAYPITPQTTIVEEYAKYVAQGRVHYFVAGGGFGGMPADSGSSASAEIAAWVAQTFPSTTVDGVTVYDLSGSTTAAGTGPTSSA